MLNIFQGILRDDRIEWDGSSPQPLLQGQGIRVEIRLLEPAASEVQGARMAACLEQIATGGSPTKFGEPMTWEREQRQDRPLPNRDES